MPIVQRQAIVPYSAEEMYNIVNNVAEYSKFLPWCRSSEVHSQTEDEVHATLELARGGLHKSFTTCNRLQKNKLIEIRLVNGPFEHLEGFWRFQPIDETSSQVFFDLEFRFKGKIANFAFGPIFQQISNSLVDAFCKRARDLYGER